MCLIPYANLHVNTFLSLLCVHIQVIMRMAMCQMRLDTVPFVIPLCGIF